MTRPIPFPDPAAGHQPAGSRSHQPRSIVANGIHLWECRRCGARWLPGEKPPGSCEPAGSRGGATTKRCSKCGETKRLSEFTRRAAASDGRASQCRDCDAVRAKAYAQRKARERNLPPNLEQPRFANRKLPRGPRTDARTLDELLEAW